jgi:hypothetical protein
MATGSPALEVDRDHGRRVRRLLGRKRARENVVRDFLGRILEHLALGRGMQQVRVDRERCLAALVLGDRDLVLLGKAMSCSRERRSHSRQGAITVTSGFSA